MRSAVFVLMGLGVLVFIIVLIVVLRQSRSLIKRAQKIDPTVKTAAEANIVLTKDIAQNIGNNDSNK